MQQLSGLDASFLYLETPNSPMHIGGLTIYDPSTAKDGKVGFKQILANVAQRAHMVATFNNVLLEVPLKLDHPYWRSAGQFDPEFHIRHIALPKPGDWRQLCIQVARLHARPLDRARPLWEMYVIEGLDNLEGYPSGCFALVTKMHHAAIDGASGIEIAATIHDLSPDYNVDQQIEPVTTDRKPTAMELIWRSQINSLRTPRRVFEVAKNSVPGLAKMATGLARGRLKRITDIPRTRFNTNVSPHRVVEAAEFDLDAIKAIKNAVPGVTVNDVAIAICGGALRRYLADKQELPERSLVAMAPINVRTHDKRGTAGNQVSQMTVEVGSQIDDPLARLDFVHKSTRAAKQLTNAVGAKTMTDYAQFIPSTLSAAAARLYSQLGMANRVKPAYNCVITNVPGPQIPLYFTGAKMLSSFALGPPIDGMGLFHGLGSYCGKFNITISACREMMPDPAFYARCLNDAFAELHQATSADGVREAQSTTKQVRSEKNQTKVMTKRKKKSGNKNRSTTSKPASK
ncbi:diacylglycerol O-acyltransferase [Arenicella chitinivorans]|uniref:diacylglycerol O-acyltransferase n=1 Tax=Arenicella chitinivorans TaxID=1329800 RepID=A0A918VJD3_9GAMM|nr:wax ester/triacylglycerol synthase family O-acyltransferase [Arenicella chitinivorans]GHA00886.1 diacylglycerol O-acyltransferase [Arenicella chitinivorans]